MEYMAVKSIKIKNLLSFDELMIDNFEDITCIVGMNNSGKSNLLKLIRFFYNKLDGKRELPPTLNSNYSTFGTITITYLISSRIKKQLKKQGKKNLFKDKKNSSSFWTYIDDINHDTFYDLTLKIHSNDLVEWSIVDYEILYTIRYLFPFFDIEARHIDLHNWDKLWQIVSSLKSFNLKKLEQSFFSQKNTEYTNYLNILNSTIETTKYTYKEKVLAYIKIGLEGDKFLIENQNLETQSDGTNAHKFIELSLKLFILLTRREYITPIIYIDEPELGLHPKRNEELIENIYKIYNDNKSKTPYPTIIFATHSPNIVKQTIKLFNSNQQILHFSKKNDTPTIVQKMNSTYDDRRFLNIFSDNEARLFFSNFIFFVEGETELEIFQNKKIIEKFSKLRKIDVYATNNVVLKYINPSYANTAIPYLILYDADKILDIDLEKNKINLKNEVVNFNKLKKKYNNSYRNFKNKSVHNDVLKAINTYLSIIENPKLKIKKKMYIESFTYNGKNYSYNNLMEYCNEYIFKRENKFFTRTTIEETLINEKSLDLFKKWLKNIFMESIQIKDNDKKENDGKTIKTIQKMMQKYPKEVKLPQVFNIIFTTKEYYTANIPENEKKFAEKIKMRYFQSIMRFIDKHFKNDKELVTLFLLIFNGKTETLISRENTNYMTYINEDYRDLIKTIRLEKFEKLDYLFSKTSGWATSFLNYAINEIEKGKEENVFRKEFKKYFGELYDIITLIEEKLKFDR
ncbi:retron Eco8 family effector endonuclease [Sulfurovum sp. XTW-4]|uniref:Retron Eco8 family effector endonuclease n=1 Tax=Sulfurovum xiamenensis TaxID=3019066 RepID=A0ABT7QUY1_9BACT|nr:retron Eco8 family effector endonuclease [Sulfurovum xiamenensis]MDM5264577.1 retron Eco8 family effector endonuclease [Sulfurovum xiamenensis]